MSKGEISVQKCSTPVVLILAPRFETSLKVLDAIKAVQPSRLYVVADKGWSPETIKRYNELKRIISEIDWTEVRTNYADENMGPKMRLATGISWVFEHEEQAIILEHDCLPDSSFFPFCEELLEKYKDDARVMHIGGNNFFSAFGVEYQCPDSYFFTHIPHIWGWATWRRAWEHYDVKVKRWPEARTRNLLENVFRDSAVANRWATRFQEYYEGKIESWDGQWSFAVVAEGGLCINPAVNLVTNIGFGPEAFSAKDAKSPLAQLPLESLKTPVKHPTFLSIDFRAEALIQKYCFGINKTFAQRMKWRLKENLPFGYQIAKRIFRRA